MKKFGYVIVFAVMLCAGLVHQYSLFQTVDKLNTRVEDFINQDIEVEYNYFLWLHERIDHLEDEEITMYIKLRKYYRLPKDEE